MTRGPDRPRLLLVGGSGGLVGRALLPELQSSWTVRSVHRSSVPAEAEGSVEWVPADVASVTEWEPLLREADCVVNVAWYRWASERTFRNLGEGLHRLLQAAVQMRIPRFLQVSVPPAPKQLESRLPYLLYKRRFDEALASSGLSYRILRPSMLYGPGDRLLSVMMRLMERYHRFPMFGDGDYHVSPLSSRDLARALALEARGTSVGTLDIGGPVRFRYQDLTDLMFAKLRRTARYVRLGRSLALALTSLLSAAGSTLLYPYEVEWLMSDRLGLEPGEVIDRPLERVEGFLELESVRLQGSRGTAEA
jgi:uncharacterized protein YbjT (DUF2867 family)